MMLSRAGRNFAGGVNRATERWRGPVAAGCIAAAILWLIWYFTRPPCTMASAAQGICHPGLVAQYINYQIAAQCMLVGMAATTLKGGYDQLMLNRERKRADEAEERLAEERRRNDERMETLYAELREERQQHLAIQQQYQAAQQQYQAAQQQYQAAQQQYQAAQQQQYQAAQQQYQAAQEQYQAAQQQNYAVQQQMLAAQQETLNRIAETQSLLLQMLQRRQNGHDQAAPEN